MPEARRLVLAMAEPEGRRRLLLGWSAWRRTHQAVAARCRKASRAAKRAARHALGREGPPETAVIVPEEARLTDEHMGGWFALCCRPKGARCRRPTDATSCG